MSWRRKSFEVLPALSVRRDHLRRSLRLVTIAWMFGIVWQSSFMGAQLTRWGELLGFDDSDFGWFMGIASAAWLAQLMAATAIERTGIRKYRFMFFALACRLMWLVIAALPLVFRPGRAAVRAYIVAYGIMAVMAHLSDPAWRNWMGDLIPRRIRGRYFANRMVWSMPIRLLTALVIGLVLDQVDNRAPDYMLPAISIIFSIGAIFGIIDVLMFRNMREIASPQLAQPSTGPRLPMVRALAKAARDAVLAVVRTVRDGGFMHFALYTCTISFAMTVGGQFFWRNALRNLGVSYFGANMMFLVSSSITVLLMTRLVWGKLIDRWGRRPVLILATIGTVFSPLGWFFIPASGVASLAEVLGGGQWAWQTFGTASWMAYLLGSATCMLGGASWSGLELARFNIILGFGQGAGRSRYIATAAVFMAAGGLIGGVLGGQLAEGCRHLAYDKAPLVVGPFRWNNWHLTFLVSAAARALSLLFLIGMPDPGAKPFRDVVRHLRLNVYNNALIRMFTWPWRQRRNNNNDSRTLFRPLRLFVRRPKPPQDKAA